MDSLQLLYSSVLFTVFMVEKEYVVAKLLNLRKSIIYSAVNINANHNSRIIFFKKLELILPKNSCGFIFAYWRINFLADLPKITLKSTKINLAKINFFKVDNNNNISNRVSKIRRKKLFGQNPLR